LFRVYEVEEDVLVKRGFGRDEFIWNYSRWTLSSFVDICMDEFIKRDLPGYSTGGRI